MGVNPASFSRGLAAVPRPAYDDQAKENPSPMLWRQRTGLLNTNLETARFLAGASRKRGRLRKIVAHFEPRNGVAQQGRQSPNGDTRMRDRSNAPSPSDLAGLLADQGIRLKRQEPGRWHRTICPQCRDKEASLSVRIYDDEDGALWKCHRSKCGWEGWGRLRQPAQDRHRTSIPEQTPQPRSSSDKAELARQVWQEARPAPGSLVETYLASRGLTLPPGAPLRFHPACPRGKERLPAMVALMTDPVTGEPSGGIHRTFLAPDGRGKAAGAAKMMLGPAGVIRLVPDEEIGSGLGISEGIETALAVMQGWGWRPVWATGSAGGIKGFPVVPGIECLTIFPDADDNGASVEASEACRVRWKEAGREVQWGVPPKGTDFADLMARRAA